jgi:hypothetical protein
MATDKTKIMKLLTNVVTFAMSNNAIAAPTTTIATLNGVIRN